MAAKTRAAELRVPMRRFIEDALESAVNPDSAALTASAGASSAPPSIWDDQYIGAQARQPLGSPLDLSEEEARRVALGAFGASIEPGEHISPGRQRLEQRAHGDVGDPVELSDEDAAMFLRDALSFGTFGSSEAGNG